MKLGATLILILWIALLGVQSACAGGVLNHCTQGHTGHAQPSERDTHSCGQDPCSLGYNAPAKTKQVRIPPQTTWIRSTEAPLTAWITPIAISGAALPALGEPPRPAGRFPLLI